MDTLAGYKISKDPYFNMDFDQKLMMIRNELVSQLDKRSWTPAHANELNDILRNIHSMMGLEESNEDEK